MFESLRLLQMVDYTDTENIRKPCLLLGSVPFSCLPGSEAHRSRVLKGFQQEQLQLQRKSEKEHEGTLLY